ncbi:MAG: lysozyme [Blastopirellula sp.]|nr:MAG: lysozyme [Blastopirellula sp.]
MNDLEKFIEAHEGNESHPYTDGVGKITIGVGHNLTDNGLSPAIIAAILAEDIAIAKSELSRKYRKWQELSEKRQMVLIDMMFNLGYPRYSTFKRFWKALRKARYDDAANEMLDSRWAKQVGPRALRLAKMMREG